MIAPACPKTKAQLATGDFVSGINHTVVLKARDDLFDPSTGDEIVCDDGTKLPGLQLCSNDAITAIPDNVGCCEVVSVGSEVQNVKPGDTVFIDFFDVRQGAILGDPESLKGIELYIANDDAFKAYFDPVTRTITPMPGYVITKRAPDRMKVALTGTDRVHVPPNTLTTGIVSGRTSEGTPFAFVAYEEIVSVGAPEYESPHRPLTKAERALLDCFVHGCGPNQECLDDFLAERAAPRALDVKPGDLVTFSTDFSIQTRVRGEFVKIVPQSALLCVIDDAQVLDDAVRAGKAGQLQLAV